MAGSIFFLSPDMSRSPILEQARLLDDNMGPPHKHLFMVTMELATVTSHLIYTSTSALSCPCVLSLSVFHTLSNMPVEENTRGMRAAAAAAVAATTAVANLLKRRDPGGMHGSLQGNVTGSLEQTRNIGTPLWMAPEVASH